MNRTGQMHPKKGRGVLALSFSFFMIYVARLDLIQDVILISICNSVVVANMAVYLAGP